MAKGVIIQAEELNTVLGVLKEKNYKIYEKPYELNIVGVRTNNNVPNKFDDRMYVFWKTDQGVWDGKRYKITTDPGLYWLSNPMSTLGTAILKAGQYVDTYAIGFHTTKSRSFEALVQRLRQVTVIRDGNRDNVLDFNSTREESGMFGINIHKAANVGETINVGQFSAGCQVFANVEDFDEVMKLANKHKKLYRNVFTYTLIDDKAYKTYLQNHPLTAPITFELPQDQTAADLASSIEEVESSQPLVEPNDQMIEQPGGLNDIPISDVEEVVTVVNSQSNTINNSTDQAQAIINSDRVVVNAKEDYLFLCGESGVWITSKNPVNIDSDTTCTISAQDGIYLGTPYKDTPYDFDNQKQPTSLGDPTKNKRYEPVILGEKLVNWLEDLLKILKNAEIATPAGKATFQQSIQEDLNTYISRIPEILSTIVFVDGVSHESVEPAPPPQ